MTITPKFDFIEGSFDTKEVKMLCVANENHGRVNLCINEPESCWNIPIAQIQLHSKHLYVDFKGTPFRLSWFNSNGSCIEGIRRYV